MGADRRAGLEPAALTLTPVEPRSDGPSLPQVFDISMGLRRDDVALKREVEAALARRRGDIDEVLRSYGVPLITDR